MASIKGSKTEQNLLKSFAGESQARNRYTFFASVAKKEGFEQISGIFLETAGNEKEHAEIFFKYLEGGDLEIKATYPAGKIGTTAQNLAAAAAGELMEWGTLYPNFAKVAEKEGFAAVAKSYHEISQVEAHHEDRFNRLLANVKSGTVFKKAEKTRWLCRNCGYVHEGTTAPKTCPACKHPQAYYELLCEGY
jgi:rubrerythrin